MLPLTVVLEQEDAVLSYFPIIPILIALCAVIGGLIGWFYESGGLSPAARIADKHYGLSDRLLTAVSILQKERGLTVMERLQLEDAAGYAKQVIPTEVERQYDILPTAVRKRGVRYTVFYFTVILLLQTLFFTFLYFREIKPEQTAALPDTTPEVMLVSQPVDTLLGKMRQISKKTADGRRKTAEEKQKDTKLNSAVEVSEAMRQKLRYWDTQAKIDSMNDIADALDLAEATRKAAEALKDKRFADAAKDLKQMNSDLIATMSNKERREVADMLQKAMQKSKERGQTSIAETVEKIESSLKMGEAEGFSELAEESKKLALQQQMEDMKNMTMTYTEGSGTSKDTEKSKQEGKSFGTGEAGDPTSGQATELEGKKERQELSGIIGNEGDSEFEKNKEGHPKTTEREYSELQYVIKKVPEEVLNKEPLPLEQRQTLRRYFELLQQQK
ncbi:MAG: hypothetical protein FWE67_13570 [Planctomycetaceae bacterium]|nr:hypothetical protein [Planctomycetaceae bacterium]